MGWTVAPGDDVTLQFRNNRTVSVTDNMFEALRLLRPALIKAARRKGTITYGDAAEVTNHAYIARGMGDLLDVLSVDCELRGEPSLACLVVRKDTGEVGASFVGNAAAGGIVKTCGSACHAAC